MRRSTIISSIRLVHTTTNIIRDMCDVRVQASQLWFIEGLDRRILMKHHVYEREAVHTGLNGLP